MRKRGSGVRVMIETRGLTKSYSTARALDGVCFTAREGEVVALLGSNGAGKTTLLKCLLGLIHFEGAARVGGVDVSMFGKQVRRMIGYLPQTPGFPSHLTAGEALAYFAALRGLRDEDIDTRLDTLGLIPHAAKRVSALSGGLRQRLGLAVALLGDPSVLLLDEPVANLDPEGRALFTDLIADLKARGRTVLLSTHAFDMLEQVADRALVLSGGSVTYDGSLDGLTRRGERPARLVATLSTEEVGVAYAALLKADVPPGAISVEGGSIEAALERLQGEAVA
jgi:ABC-type multidrug transport system ATPase subunit